MFDTEQLTLICLMEITLPDERYIRLCDGGFVFWGVKRFDSFDPEFGTIESVEDFEERTGDEAPGGKLVFLPTENADPALLSDETYQGARMQFWTAELNQTTGEVVGAPDLTADLAIDTTTLRGGRGNRKLDVEFVSSAIRLFMIYRGQALSSRFHQTCYPGEKGFDNATGEPEVVAWGALPAVSAGESGGSGANFVNRGQIANL